MIPVTPLNYPLNRSGKLFCLCSSGSTFFTSQLLMAGEAGVILKDLGQIITHTLDQDLYQ